jgi:hypothetical protein
MIYQLLLNIKIAQINVKPALMQPLAKNVEEIGLEVLPVSVLMVNLMEMENIATLVITHVLNALLAQPIVFNAKEID